VTPSVENTSTNAPSAPPLCATYPLGANADYRYLAMKLWELFRRRMDAAAAASASPWDRTDEGEWVPAIVAFAVGTRSSTEFRLELFPGSGHVDGGIPVFVPPEVIPPPLRVPGARVMVLSLEGRPTAVREPGPKARAWFASYVDRASR
jgi:hypothetical protein